MQCGPVQLTKLRANEITCQDEAFVQAEVSPLVRFVDVKKYTDAAGNPKEEVESVSTATVKIGLEYQKTLSTTVDCLSGSSNSASNCPLQVAGLYADPASPSLYTSVKDLTSRRNDKCPGWYEKKELLR